MPQISRTIATSASTISNRALSSLANHLNSYQGASITFAGGASTVASLGGNGVGAWQ